MRRERKKWRSNWRAGGNSFRDFVNAALRDLLHATSRSFWLTLRVLPAAVRPQIGLAYLLARIADTIADTELVPLAQRLEALQKLRERILGESAAALAFGELARQQGAPAERALLENFEAALAELQKLSAADLALTRQVLATITGGQELDLKRFAGSAGVSPAVCGVAPQTMPIELVHVVEVETTSTARGTRALPEIIALQTDAELDDYTYRVAGCVGEFWTKLCRAHLFPSAALDDVRLLENGARFGKGLQLVNILRDLPADLRRGRCYLPADDLAKAGLTPADLLLPVNGARFRPVYDALLARAEAHLAAGWAYTNALPRRCVRVRLACAWPILIGLETLRRLRIGEVLDPSRRIKISRPEVRRIILRTLICYPWPHAWRRLMPETPG